MKILIIGGTGLIGPHLIREISSRSPKYQVHTLTREGRRVLIETPHKCDRQDSRELNRIIKDISPDCVIDMIPLNKQHAEILSDAINDHIPQCHLIAISSIDVYAAYAKLHNTESTSYHPCPLTEDMPLRNRPGPKGLAYDKIGIEQIYKQTIENLTILRLPAIYGWPDTTRVSQYLDKMLEGRTTISLSPVKSVWTFSRCLHKNAGFGIFRTVESPGQGHHIYNLGEKTDYTEYEWCRKIARAAGWHGEIIIDDTISEDTDFHQHFTVCSDKIRNERGYYETYDPEAGLTDTVMFHSYIRRNKPYKKEY